MTTKTALLKLIRAKCLDCCCHQPGEVQKCTAVACTLHPFRFGKDPNPSKVGFAKSPTPSREVLGKETPSERDQRLFPGHEGQLRSLSESLGSWRGIP
jgi:hypothetical protein